MQVVYPIQELISSVAVTISITLAPSEHLDALSWKI